MGRHIGFLVYPGFDLLDLTGPMEVFQWAEGLHPGSYQSRVMSASGGMIESAAGLKVVTEGLVTEPLDTLVAVGGAHPGSVMPTSFLDYLRQASSVARRTTSVCTGSFILAAAGLLDGRPATTHWLYAAELQARYPAVLVDGDRIFTHEGAIWTSAGITAGIDMCLALVEEDLGLEASRQVARGLVVYHRRSGGQRQYSSLLDMHSESERVSSVLIYAREHLNELLTVDRLAEVANLSVRQFGRAFQAAIGTPPAKAIERLRVDAARSHIEDGRQSLEDVARAVGFGDARRMCQSFIRIYGHTPQAMRRVARSTQRSRYFRAF